jgi:hypothetical protein
MSDRSPPDAGMPPLNMGTWISGAPNNIAVVPMGGPMYSPSGPYTIVTGAKFPDLGWDPALRAQVILAEFAAAGWQSQVDPGPPRDAPADLVAEISSMAELANTNLRERRLAEIIAQAQDASIYWTDMLMLTPAARPWTCCLIAAAQAVGQMVAMHFKYKYMRQRPVQVFPAIMPPVTTPPHPSYPNSHALQGHLISLCVAAACPVLRDPLMALADRVGENRVIAGLHFPSDTSASVTMAGELMPLLSAGAEFQKVLAGATAEFGNLGTFSTTRT